MKPCDGMKASDDASPTLIPSSVRADGSIRKPIKIRPGFIPQAERPKYVAPHARAVEGKGGEEEVISLFPKRPYYGPFPHQMTDDEVTAWLEAKPWLQSGEGRRRRS